MAGFSRPEGGWRFRFEGIKTNDRADALQATKYPYVQNIRSVDEYSIQTRPGYEKMFSTAGLPITDIRSYSALDTDNNPRILARNSINQIYLDTGALVATLDGASQGVFMLPYRPNQSPQAWMYIGAQQDYKKISAPESNAVAVYKVGIKEPSSPPDVSPMSFNYFGFSAPAANWTPGGSAGATSDAARVADTVTTAIADPASGGVRWSVQVASNKSYQIWETVQMGGFTTIVEDVLPPLASGATLTIQSIQYYSGSTGRCVIVPTQMPIGQAAPKYAGSNPAVASVYSETMLSSLRRGSLVNLNSTETVMVLSVTTGPSGIIAFEVSTTGTFLAGQSIVGIPAIIVSDINATVIGQAIAAVQVDSTLTGAGTGTLSQTLANNPFAKALFPSSNTAQLDDYVSFQIKISDLSKLVQGVITFDVRNGAPDYVTDAYYYIFNITNIIIPPVLIPPSDTVLTNQPPPANSSGATRQISYTFDDPYTGETKTITIEVPDFTVGEPPTVDNLTPLPLAQWATVMIPIRSLIRLGGDQSRTLANCQGVRVTLQTTSTVSVSISSFWVGGGAQPDVSDNTPLFYCVRGRNTATGAPGNPSPITRYGVSPRRQQVQVTITDTVNDAQNDIWDVFRFGGTVLSWRYIGSVPNTGPTVTFIDNFFDSAALAGDLLDFDNFEPWPTIGLPFKAIAGVSGGITTSVQVKGTVVLLMYYSDSPFPNPAPATILRWLPGTLVQIGGQNAYTLWARPTTIELVPPPAAFCYCYMLQFVESIGSLAPSAMVINEPAVARQVLPYLWGADASGTIFGTGDPLRPASVYYCKSFNPDSAPSRYNQEISSPSEPMLGGEVLDGLSLAASSRRWWALFPNFGTTGPRYQAVERPIGRGLAAPYAHCTDGKNLFFVAKDGIWMAPGAGAGRSLTDDDLYNLFPHEGVNTPTNYVYATYTIYAPDYKYASNFRLSCGNSYLKFDYRDSGNVPRTLICDLRDLNKPAWAPDFYAGFMCIHYTVEQQESTLLTDGTRYSMEILGESNGDVHKQQALSNDNGVAINCVVSTFEYNGGDLRNTDLYNDAWFDIVPVSGMQIAPLTEGVGQAPTKVIAPSTSRVQTNIPVGVELTNMGLLLVWTDDFNSQALPTILNAWQPLYQSVPISVIQWKTQGTTFGLLGYKHIRQLLFAYRSTAIVNLTITVYDGSNPAVIPLPSTGGALRKTMLPLTFNKGLLYFFLGRTVDDSEWTPYLSECECYVGSWGRGNEYTVIRDIEGPVGIRS